MNVFRLKWFFQSQEEQKRRITAFEKVKEVTKSLWCFVPIELFGPSCTLRSETKQTLIGSGGFPNLEEKQIEIYFVDLQLLEPRFSWSGSHTTARQQKQFSKDEAKDAEKIKHWQRNSGAKALSTSTNSTLLVQSRSFNKHWNLGQTSAAWFCLAKGEKYN